MLKFFAGRVGSGGFLGWENLRSGESEVGSGGFLGWENLRSGESEVGRLCVFELGESEKRRVGGWEVGGGAW